jgi:hypothetical protein
MSDPFRALYPTKIDFSYNPRRADAVNRSRIDFFIISDDILNSIEDCYILDNLQSTLFDHKAVNLTFSGRGNRGNKITSVSNKILKDPDSSLIVDIACKEAYIIYQDRPNQEKDLLLRKIGKCRKLLREAGPCFIFYGLEDDGEGREDRLLRREQKINMVNDLRFQEDLCAVLDHPTNIEPDFFFDMLINHVKNELVSYQCFIFSFLRREKNALLDTLKMLKSDYINNLVLIQEKEHQLKNLSERDIERALEFHPLYEHLSGEKMSSSFLKLVKGAKSKETLDVITNDGINFRNDAEREEHIVKYYEDIYKIPANCPLNFEGLIENFLGPEICSNPAVIASKLSREEAALLDQPVSIQELDESAAEGKVRTAAGADGINNAFVKHFWQYFRCPLLNYMNCCFRKKTLTSNFATANIKLIPKKGDLSNIKNWRPISLLSCFYKVISRTINNRLKLFNDKFFSRAQKGFTSSRHIQEVILNITQTMGYCKDKNICAALVSVDLAKAFDTILHGYVRAAFKFFGVGDTFLDMMDTLGTGRSAQIILNGVKVSRKFALGTGRPQGDTPSPISFNVGEQILLFKIEYDPGIISVFSGNVVPRNKFPLLQEDLHPNFRYESGGETDKTDAFADDATVITLMQRDCLLRLKAILDEFGGISGLLCNFDKTMVMNIGLLANDVRFLQEIGFSVTDKIKLLGFHLGREGLDYDTMFRNVTRNICAIATQWSRFKLSLPGRISIFKNLMLSQVSYIGSISCPHSDVIEEIQNIMNRFVLGNLKVSRERLYTDPDHGGLGLIELKSFISGLISSWVPLAAKSTRDNWRVDLHSLSGGNCYTVNPDYVNAVSNPVLNTIAVEYAKFSKKFFGLNDNYMEMFIFRNKEIKMGRVNVPVLDENFFSANVPQLDINVVSKLKIKDFFNGRIFKPRMDLIRDTGIQFNLLVYMRLREAVAGYRDLRSRQQSDGSSKSVERLFQGKKGNSKKIRLVLSPTAGSKDTGKLQHVKTFLRLSEIDPDTGTLARLVGLWNCHFLPNKIREFFYRFITNSLPLNTRLSNYVRNVNRNCTLCLIDRLPAPVEESFIHLFSRCPVSSRIHRWFLDKYFPDTFNDNDTKVFLLGGGAVGRVSQNFVLIIPLLWQFLIWEMKLQKRVLSPLTLDNDFRFIIKGICSYNKKLLFGLNSFNQNVVVRWDWCNLRNGT